MIYTDSASPRVPWRALRAAFLEFVDVKNAFEEYLWMIALATWHSRKLFGIIRISKQGVTNTRIGL